MQKKNVFYDSTILGTPNRHVPIVVLVVKSIKTGNFLFFSPTFLGCRTVIIKIRNSNEFSVSNLPNKGQNSLIWLSEKSTSNQTNSSGCGLTTGTKIIPFLRSYYVRNRNVGSNPCYSDENSFKIKFH